MRRIDGRRIQTFPEVQAEDYFKDSPFSGAMLGGSLIYVDIPSGNAGSCWPLVPADRRCPHPLMYRSTILLISSTSTTGDMRFETLAFRLALLSLLGACIIAHYWIISASWLSSLCHVPGYPGNFNFTIYYEQNGVQDQDYQPISSASPLQIIITLI